MKKALVLALMLAFSLTQFAFSALAEDGKALFEKKLCIQCHGEGGRSKTSQYPHLAGQSKQYLTNQFASIVQGKRSAGSTVLMEKHPKLKEFNDKDIETIAGYLSSLPRKASPGEADAASITKGEVLFKNLGCPQCHGAGGKGMGEDPQFLAYPKLNGQHADYLFWQMKRILEGTRTNDHANKMREKFKAEKITDVELRSLASYLSSVE
ncbi:MAG: hypothetical protein A2600_01065 [Candidatus Lambdaproteobacteria bacterium RIFOXYD1_FULL_56_27]|uniref:Cytochrome c domain-containing protein n=1 Tax=Candidatus Lambdaproteobacteria bacterium RIFOXYD2_FULL_56_26 TaxID=1817773 RepID=A0A1F6GS61_9PROT|nr:MAG: hypothetical protein A2557_00180 [Candidatus Lambdaproteobacteria bacterium RIFOXYD2_FULL_56_26]OGH01330.1 MAG: hypothetical protein A2426_13015 [Candidatus Lambdaproteobacteria bacterium RIFOXYC1_FULL_56_13]OGH06870.1 MAG: hypothetical protein A2600_01065 [Candidatus Lambdaproteobacteria bacterium RIFOXYD1_FULL_56_27]